VHIFEICSEASDVPMNAAHRTYLALGDSMSIDEYTGIAGGGAVKQFFSRLGGGWTLDDRTSDGCRIQHVPVDGRGDVITLTIGGNDLLWNREEYLARGLTGFTREHIRLLESLRRANPQALMIVGDVYRPHATLTPRESDALSAANRAIAANCLRVGARLARVHDAFRGHEEEFLCFQIEPTLRGAQAIAMLFQQAFEEAHGCQSAYP
jgi:lysophospholipase L1-like esterase